MLSGYKSKLLHSSKLEAGLHPEDFISNRKGVHGMLGARRWDSSGRKIWAFWEERLTREFAGLKPSKLVIRNRRQIFIKLMGTKSYRFQAALKHTSSFSREGKDALS